LKNILITGSNGQLGQELQELSKRFTDYRFHFYNRSELDIADAEKVTKILTDTKPDYCINCAAYTAVDKAESERGIAYAINASGPAHLAAACKQTAARFIHISTDYVFDGSGSEPYREEDVTGPLGVYGASKLEGETQAMAANPDAVIIRTSWVYSVYGANFVKTMIRLMAAKPGISVVADQWGSPTWAADLAAAIMSIIESVHWIPGIYHYSNDGRINWFQFADEIRLYTGSSCTVTPITTAQYPTPAPRPQNSLLHKEKIQRTYGLVIHPWKQSLHACLDRLDEGEAANL
jgi:dTDP-4-dehydrorhamnose reductase